MKAPYIIKYITPYMVKDGNTNGIYGINPEGNMLPITAQSDILGKDQLVLANNPCDAIVAYFASKTNETYRTVSTNNGDGFSTPLMINVLYAALVTSSRLKHIILFKFTPMYNLKQTMTQISIEPGGSQTSTLYGPYVYHFMDAPRPAGVLENLISRRTTNQAMCVAAKEYVNTEENRLHNHLASIVKIANEDWVIPPRPVLQGLEV